ncbi:putative transposase, partial [Phenoliferia sp. Uapishka_3]
MAIFINTTTKVTSLGLAHLFIQHVFSKHGLPTDIVSDRGNKFISTFWKSLCESLGIQQSLSTAYRPQTDGQTERVNQVVEMFLRLYVNYEQNNWSEYVALAEFAYNNSPHSSTTLTPFFANKGFNPRLEITLAPGTKEAHSVEITRIKEVHEHAKREILKAQEVQKKYADKERIEAHADFQVGKKVWLSSVNITTTRPTKKFADRRLGPFAITDLVGSHAARLALPQSMSRIHPVFHFAYLEPVAQDTIAGRRNPPPTEVVIAEQPTEYEVSAVLDSRRVSHKRVDYLIEWAGYQDDAYERETWERWDNLKGCQDLIDEFHTRHPDKPRQN